MAASGVTSFGTDETGGREVILKASSDGTPLITGRLNKEIRKESASGDYSIYYYGEPTNYLNTDLKEITFKENEKWQNTNY